MESLLIFISAIGLSYLLNAILLRFSNNFGVESRQLQNLVRWSSTSKPTTGGIAFYITFLVGGIVLLLFYPESTFSAKGFPALFLGATLAFLIGFADDAYGTHPMLKLLGQVLCAVVLIYFGIHIEFFMLRNPSLIFLDYLLTIVWVVGLMNSFNMLDNMDGVTTTITLTIMAVTITLLTRIEGLSLFFYIYVLIIGSFLGFLYFNWRPAKVYMGDTGSMYIGLLMAFVGIHYFWNVNTSPDNISLTRGGLVPLLTFLVPIMDTSFVTVARIRRGVSPFQGGRDHTTHHLVHVGVPERLVPVLLGFVSLLSGGLAVFIYVLIPEWDAQYMLLFMIYPISVFGIFIFLYRKGARIGKMKAIMAEREKIRLRLLEEMQQTEAANPLAAQS